MTSEEIRRVFLEFFEKRRHKVVPSSSLLPSDPSVLFTTAGMQRFTPYLSGEKDVLQDFGTRHLASLQKCFRANDIEEIGDDTHHTFFEMLGNWSIGEDSRRGYFKKGAIKYALDLLLDGYGLEKNKIWITVFKGNENIPKDEESKEIWQKHGIPKERIREFGEKDNLWGPVAETGPCGPNTEIHYDRGEKYGCLSSDCGPNCDKCQRFIEIWNLVFMEYFKDEDGTFKALPFKNVDTGAGFERLVSVLQGKPSAYETDLFWSLIQKLVEGSSFEYEEEKRKFRIIVDHIRGAVFLTAEGVSPSNTEQGYVLRRLLRKSMVFLKLLELPDNFQIILAKEVINIYKKIYPEISSKQAEILTIIQKEEEKFNKTLEKGIKEFDKVIDSCGKSKQLEGEEAFKLYSTYGFPIEIMRDICKERGIKLCDEECQKLIKEHQEISRAGAENKFGGLGKEADYNSVKLHTATHLLHEALRRVLGNKASQMGSDITSERLRFDFSCPQKMTKEEIKEVEKIVNKKIKEDLKVEKREMSYQEAINSGALAFFKEKYPEKVSVYSIENFSKEICAGPHVKRTSELGKFEIKKEKSSSAGVRRIKAILKDN